MRSPHLGRSRTKINRPSERLAAGSSGAVEGSSSTNGSGPDHGSSCDESDDEDLDRRTDNSVPETGAQLDGAVSTDS